MRDRVRSLVRRSVGEEAFIAIRAAWWRWKLRRNGYEAETRFLRDFVPRGGVCIDAGGNFGQYAYYLSRLVGSLGVVHSFEPLAYNRRVFQRVVHAANVTLHPVALGATSGETRINADDGNTGEAHVGERGEQVPVMTLDAWGAALPRLDFMKLDVEGYELHVLRGAESLVARYKPVILCEIGDHARRYGFEPSEVFRFLEIAGYRAWVVRGRALLRVDEWLPNRINYFFTQ